MKTQTAFVSTVFVAAIVLATGSRSPGQPTDNVFRQREEKSQIYDPIVIEDNEQFQHIQQILKTKGDFDWQDIALLQLVEVTKKRFDLSVVVDENDLQDNNIDVGTKLTVQRKNIPLSLALKTALAPLGITFFVEHGDVKVISASTGERMFLTRLYPISDLVGKWTGEDWHSQEIIDLMMSCLSPGGYDCAGEGGIEYVPVAQSLLVRYGVDIHEAVPPFLRALRKSDRATDEFLQAKYGKSIGEIECALAFESARSNDFRDDDDSAVDEENLEALKEKLAESQDRELEEQQRKGNALIEKAISESKEAKRIADQARKLVEKLEKEIAELR